MVNEVRMHPVTIRFSPMHSGTIDGWNVYGPRRVDRISGA